MKIIITDRKSLAVVVSGVLLVVFVFSGKSAEVLQFLIDAIRAFHQ